VFLASSVVESLKKNKNLTTYGLDLVVCPVKSCNVNPDNCDKGRNESCVKKVDIVYEHNGHNKLIVLLFRYQLKGYDKEGFIKIEDLALNVLLERGIILKEDLKK